MKSGLKIAVCFLLLAGCKNPLQNNLPNAMGDDEAGNIKKRNLWFEAMHRAAPGINWRTIEAANAINAEAIKMQQRLNYNPTNTLETFANGQLTGTWSERGAGNITGSNIAVDYDAPTNNIYTISAGGSLWRGPLTGNSWTLLNDNVQFSSRVIKVFNKNGGGRRLLLSKADSLYWSDNEGSTLNPCNGITFPVAWGGNYIASVEVLNDAGQTIYVLTHNWDNVLGWAARHYLFRSTDGGLNFSLINIFTTGNDNEVSMVNPYNSNLIYVTDVGAVANRIALYEVNAATVTLIPSSTSVTNNGSSPLAGVFLGNTLTLYLLKSNNQLYSRVNNSGAWADWMPVNATPSTSWDRLDVGMSDANKVYYGEVDAFRSYDAGLNFTRVNYWYEYYNDIAGKLHADIMQIKHFRKSDNTIFQLINNHGGVAVSYDDMLTTTNLTLNSFYNSQSYDIITDTLNTNNLFSGTQDQGMQFCNNTLTPGILNFNQIISGDYGYLALTSGNSRLWAIYPGQVVYWTDPTGTGGTTQFWPIPGTNIPNYGWMPPLKSSNKTSANLVYVAGGDIAGGSGSHLIRLSADLNPPVTFTPTQFSYDFRVNSNNGASNISSFELSKKDPANIYVATEDGTFFYSNDYGVSWNKTASFNGTTGWYLYGQTILASRLTSGLVWYGGSGYSNPAIFKSTDAGVSFTAMNNGLPQTLVHEIVADSTESMLFAATDAGPYVYVVADNLWYPMIGAITPTQMFTAVEYIRSSNTVRFATHGRGIFDFKIGSGNLPITGLQLSAKLNANKSILLNWKTLTETNNKYFDLERSSNAVAYEKVTAVNAYGNGNSYVEQTYQFTDIKPVSGTNFYRVKQVDKDGKSTYSNVVKINLDKGIEIILAPNPVKNTFSLYPATEIKEVRLYDVSGKFVRVFNTALKYDITGVPPGIYFLYIRNKKDEVQKIKLLKE